MPLDNSGYITSQAIDWNGLTNGLSKTIYDIGENRVIRKKELDDQFADMDRQFRQAKVPDNQSLTNLFLNITDAGTQKILEWNRDLKNGKMSESENKRLMSNIKNSFTGTISSVADLDKKIADMAKRQDKDGDGGNFELDLAKITGSLMELQGKTGAIDVDGNIKIGKVDPVTGKITSMYDPEVLNKPENVKADKYRLRENVQNSVKNWKPVEQWTKGVRDGSITIDSIKQQPEYKEGLETLAKSIANKSNPRTIYSILSDNAGIALTSYQTEEEKNQKIKEQTDELISTKKEAGTWDPKVGLTEVERKGIENNMFKLVPDDASVFQPEMTEEQNKRALDYTRTEIGMQIETNMKGEAPTVFAPRAPSGDGKGPKDTKEQNYDAYRYAFDTWNSGNVQEAAARYTAMTQGDMIFTPNVPVDENDKPIPGAKARPGFRLTTKEGTPAGIITRFQDMADYIYPGASPADRQYNMQEGQQAYRDRNRGRANDIEPNKTKKTKKKKIIF